MHYSTQSALVLIDRPQALTRYTHIVRFLKTPKLHQLDSRTVELKATITITTDLGETFYPSTLSLLAGLKAPHAQDDGNSPLYALQQVDWKAGARSASISLRISTGRVKGPACLHVQADIPSTASELLLPIVDVWSSALDPSTGQPKSSQRVERKFPIPNIGTISLLEDAGDSIARHLWDGSQILAQHCLDATRSTDPQPLLPRLHRTLNQPTAGAGLNILELGCGCGTVGITLWHLLPNPCVLLTDTSEIHDLVTANISRANINNNNRPQSSTLRFEPLDWETPVPDSILDLKWDLIIVSECTYNIDTLPALVKTLLSLTTATSSPEAVIVVSTKTRHVSEAVFFELMERAGFVEEESTRLGLPGLVGTGYADCAGDVGVFVFRKDVEGG